MNTIITKKDLKQSLNFLSELNLVEGDYENIMKKFKEFFDKEKNKSILDKITKNISFEDKIDMNLIMKKIIESREMPHLNILLQRMIKHENLINDIQDYFIEKLL